MRPTCPMPNDLRAYVPGGSYFFTAALLERHRRLLTEHLDVLREAFRSVRKPRPFRIDAMVMLPDHLHCLWTLPPKDTDFSTRWRLIQSSFARAIAPGERLSARRQIKHERGIWQRRFWEHAIRDQRDLDAHWLGAARGRLAAFEFPSIRGIGCLPSSLGTFRGFPHSDE
jgi:putative transposase